MFSSCGADPSCGSTGESSVKIIMGRVTRGGPGGYLIGPRFPRKILRGGESSRSSLLSGGEEVAEETGKGYLRQSDTPNAYHRKEAESGQR